MKVRQLLVFSICICVLYTSVAQNKKPPVKQKVNTTVKKTAPVKKFVAKKPSKATVKKSVTKKRVIKQQPMSNERLVEITTDYGVMVARLYDSTPLHRDNFVNLVETGFYDSLLFHRVIEGFMIQGGDPASKNASGDQQLGMGSAPGERIPAEFRPDLFHKKGALAAARDNNPEKASSNCQFYVVQGRPYVPAELEAIVLQRIQPSNATFKYTPAQLEIYKNVGGTPFLDQSYTVFGEIISGLDVIDKISKAPKGMGDRPLQDIRMKMRMLN